MFRSAFEMARGRLVQHLGGDDPVGLYGSIAAAVVFAVGLELPNLASEPGQDLRFDGPEIGRHQHVAGPGADHRAGDVAKHRERVAERPAAGRDRRCGPLQLLSGGCCPRSSSGSAVAGRVRSNVPGPAPYILMVPRIRSSVRDAVEDALILLRRCAGAVTAQLE